MKPLTILMLFIAFLLPPLALAEDFFLKQTLFEGESQNYTVGNYVYEVKLVTVYDSQSKAVFEVNGERTGTLMKDESFRFRDGASIFIRTVMPEQSGNDFVQFNFFPVAHQEAKQLAAAAAYNNKTVSNTIISPEPEAVMPVEEVTQEQPVQVSQPAAESPKQELVAESAPVPSWWEKIKSWFRGIFS